MPVPLDVWEPYGDGDNMTLDEKRETMNTVLMEYHALCSYMMEKCPQLYPDFHAYLVEWRNTDSYPFHPVELYPDAGQDWAFDEESRGLRSPQTHDEDVSFALRRDLAVEEAERNDAEQRLLWQKWTVSLK